MFLDIDFLWVDRLKRSQRRNEYSAPYQQEHQGAEAHVPPKPSAWRKLFAGKSGNRHANRLSVGAAAVEILFSDQGLISARPPRISSVEACGGGDRRSPPPIRAPP